MPSMASKAAWFHRFDWNLFLCLLLAMSLFVHRIELLILYLKLYYHKVLGNKCSALTVLQLLVFCHYFYIWFVFIYVFPA